MADSTDLQAYPAALEFVSTLSAVDRNKIAALAVQMKAQFDAKAVAVDTTAVLNDLHGVIDNLLDLPEPQSSVIGRGCAANLNSIIDRGGVTSTLEHVVDLLTDLAVIPELAQQGKIELARFDLLVCGCRDALAYELDVMNGVRHG